MNSSSNKHTPETIDLDFGDFCTNFEETEEFDGFFNSEKRGNPEETSHNNLLDRHGKVTANGLSGFSRTSSETGTHLKNSLLDFTLPTPQKVLDNLPKPSGFSSMDTKGKNQFNLLDDDWSFEAHNKGSVGALNNLITTIKNPSEKITPNFSKINSLLPYTMPLEEQKKKNTNTPLDINDSKENSTTHDFGDFTSHHIETELHGFEEFFVSTGSSLDKSSKIPDLMNMTAELLAPKVNEIKSSLIDFDVDLLDASKSSNVKMNSAHLLDIATNLAGETHLLNLLDWGGSDSHTHLPTHLSSEPVVKNLVNSIAPVSKQIETIKKCVQNETELDFGSFSSHILNNKESFGSLFSEESPSQEMEPPLSKRTPTVSKKVEIMEEILTFPDPIDDTFTRIDEKFLLEPSLIRGKWNATVSTIFDTVQLTTTSFEDLIPNRETNEHKETPSLVTNSSEESLDFQWENSANEERHLASLNLKRKKKKINKIETLIVQELIPVVVPEVLIETDSPNSTPSARQSTELHAPPLTMSLSDSQLSEYFTKESDIVNKKRSSGSKFPIGQSILNMFNPSPKKERSKPTTSVNFDVYDASEIFT